MPKHAEIPFISHSFISRDIELEHRSDGILLLRSRVPLLPVEAHLPDMLAKQATENPGRLWLAQRRGAARQWRKLPYAEGKLQVDVVTQVLISLGMRDRCVAVLSANSLEHAVFGLAAMQARMPYVPITPAYSLLARDLSTLQSLMDLLNPAVVFVQNGQQFERTLRGLELPEDAIMICVNDPVDDLPLESWAAWLQTSVTSQVAESVAGIRPGTVAKYLFTSGSTGVPKAVVITHEMLSAGVAMHQQIEYRSAERQPMELLDWLPWSHVASGSVLFATALAEGGSIWIDDGKPIAGMFEETLKNLREISPNLYFSVPLGYAMLLDALESDTELARGFFRNLRRVGYAGAKLPESLFDRMQSVAVRTIGSRIPFISAFGSTETSGSVTIAHWCTESAGCIGLPHPGVELKMLPFGDDRYEVRVRSSAVTPGYLCQPDATAAAFDDEGFFIMGDALQFADPGRPEEGVVFGGRVAEEFKLQSGVFVRVGTLRVEAIEAAHGFISDAVVTGADQEFIALLAWLNENACRRYLGTLDTTAADLVQMPWIMDFLRKAFHEHNVRANGSSRRIRRLLLLVDPPDIGAGEITDKGYINQRQILMRRQADVARLYAEVPDAAVIEID